MFYRTSSPSGPLPKKLKNVEKVIVAKALDGQRYPLPPCEFMWMCGGKRGSGPEGADDLCLASLELQDWNLSLKGNSSLKFPAQLKILDGAC